MLAEALQVGGIVAVVIGVGLIFFPAGVIALGIGAVLLGMVMERE
jgi:hypothetical protein